MRATDQLRAATGELHQQVEGLPYFRALMEGTLDAARVARFLRGLWVIHEELERLAPDRVDVKKAPLLERDLQALGLDRFGIDPGVLRAMVLAQQLRLGGPHFLLGALYVLEGSTLGGLVQRKALEATLPADAQGYLSVYGKETRAHFEAFLEQLDQALEGGSEVSDASRGARATFEAIGDVARSAMDDSGGSLAEVLNADAGTHAIAGDLREVRAALEAGEVSWRRFPYYEARYGERGRRFTRSDSAWLAALGPEEAIDQISWLARVLASRGMPRWLLESHLFVLHQALCEAVPERAARYSGLLRAAESLRSSRLSIAPDDVLARCEAALPSLGAGALLAAAIADDRAGVAGAIASVRPWMEARFGEEAVARVVALACL